MELEPSKASGGPGDVRVGPVFVEVLTFGEPEPVKRAEALRQRCRIHLLLLEDHGVYWEGEFPGETSAAAWEDWRRRTTEAAEECAATGVPVEVPAGDGSAVTAHPGRVPMGIRLVGPLAEADQGRRLLGKLRVKCAKTAGAGTAWLWVEDHLGLGHPLVPFAQMALEQRVDALGELLLPLLEQHTHVAGVVLSTAVRRRLPLPAAETVERGAGLGLRRGLPLDRVRETIIIPRRLLLPDQTRLLARLCDTEPGWLDWALGRLRLPGGLRGLVDPAASRPTTSLWTP